jgi:hypothetical protein
MDADIKSRFEAIADAPWIEEAPIEEIDRLFIRVTGNEGMYPPRRRSRYPSRLMLEGPITGYDDAELRVAARLARHLTAIGDLTYKRDSGPFAHLRKTDGAWYALRMTWAGAGRRCDTVEEAAGVLMGGMIDDGEDLSSALQAFDTEHGHPPAPAHGI